MAYAHRPDKPYGHIYLITNLVTGRFYIGQTRRVVAERWSIHKSEAKLRCHYKLHKAIRKYGPEAFEVQTVASADSSDSLNQLEIVWIALTGAALRDIGYNTSLGGRANTPTPETRAKISARITGRTLSTEHRAKISAFQKGRVHTPVHNARKSAGLKGRTPSLACRIAVGEANKHRVYSDETRAKLSAAAQKANQVRWMRPRSTQA